MRLVWFLGCLAFCSGVFPIGVSRHVSSRPPFVNIGAIFTFNSTIGRVAKIAIEAAVDDINSNSSVLGGSKLVINMQDSNCSGFLGMFEALQFMETDIVAMVGPQSSVIAHVISHVANELQVPLLSFAATDPTLSSLQYPFFVRMTQSDLFQMSAIAELLDFYRWKNVIAVYIDNDYGRNGVSALGDKLAERRCKISYKAALPPGVTSDEIMNILVKVLMMESRIIVLHANLDSGLAVLSVAHYLGLMGNGYVWIATDWLSSVLDTSRPLAWETMESMQGILTLRQHTADSGRKRDFVSRWSKLTGKKKSDSLGLNAYGLYAYDTIWTIAHAINTFFNEGGTISFSNDPRLHDPEGASLNLEAMNIFDGGKLLLKNILQTDQMGITGPIRFDADGFLIHPAYDIINVVGTGIRNIGYWSNYSGLSIVTPETLYSKPPNRSSSNQQLKNVIWPGDMVAIPRGWVFPSNGNELRIGIPNRVSYRDFVSQVRGRDMVKGFCIDVFMAAVNLLPYAVRYRFIPYGDGQKNPSYTGLVNMITSNAFDAAVGDIAIVTNRTRIADFTQPYIESGLVIVAPVKKLNSNEWAFLRPFTLQMWCVTGAFFIVIGIVVWILEHRVNEDFRGPPRKEIITILWFSFSTLFFAHKNRAAFCGISFLCLFCPEIIGREITFSAYSAFSGPEALWILIHAERPPMPLQQLQDIQMQPNRSFCDLIDLGFFPYAEENIVSALARAILVLWLFVVLIIQSSYTASLTSILTVQQLSSSITGIDSLKASNEPIGFQVGSFIENYLIEELGIPKSRLVSLGTPEEYAAALQRGPKHGGVAAVVDELPYIELFLSTNCKFRIAGQLFTKGGWGFAFPRDSPLAVDMSTAILQLSENGDLQRIHDKWLIRSGCSLQSTEIESNTFHLKSFRGLFLICAVVCLLSLIIFFIRVIRQFIRHFRDEPNTLDQGRSGSGRLKKFLSFVNEKEKNGDEQIE